MNLDSNLNSPRRLLPDNVDVWTLSLDSGEPSSAPSFLSSDEEQRADRFHFERDRRRFIHCRSWLRTVLGSYLSVSAANIEFEYGEFGKPSIVPGQNVPDLQFNLAHAGKFAVLAVAVSRHVGVDIEQIDRLRDCIPIAERYFSVHESEELKALPEAVQALGFCACWTRKEAFIKALGTGLALPLADFSVTVHPHQPPVIREVRRDLRDRQWWLQDLPAPKGYRSALVVEGGACRVQHRGDIPEGVDALR